MPQHPTIFINVNQQQIGESKLFYSVEFKKRMTYIIYPFSTYQGIPFHGNLLVNLTHHLTWLSHK